MQGSDVCMFVKERGDLHSVSRCKRFLTDPPDPASFTNGSPHVAVMPMPVRMTLLGKTLGSE